MCENAGKYKNWNEIKNIKCVITKCHVRYYEASRALVRSISVECDAPERGVAVGSEL